MPRRKFIDKKNATTFSLVYRAQNDPLIHDSEASDMVFKEVAAPNTNKIKRRQDLDAEFNGALRSNEGEAANYGIFYDDTEYDYMQHLRELGTGNEGYFVEAITGSKDKGKGKQKLEDALREISLDDERSSIASSVQSSVASELLGDEVLPSEFVRPSNYQDQQDVPDAIAGFQPDMDPRLREVLEALEDEAYVDDEDDIFAELAKGVEVVDQDEWESSHWKIEEQQEEDGWETDDTIKADTKGGKPEKKLDDTDTHEAPDGGPVEPVDDHGDSNWMAEFSKFKKAANSAQPKNPGAARTASEFQSIITGSSALTSGRRKKRKGALTSTSGYSMSSSILARTDTQTLLDQRFDKIEEEYAGDAEYDYDDDMSQASGMTGLSHISGVSKMSGLSSASEKPPQLVMAGLEGVMDDFLGSYSTTGKRNRLKKGRQQTGLEQLDEIRQGLGQARIKPQRA